MSRVTRRKHVLKEMMEDDFELPKPNQQIVRVLSSRGNNLHQVESPQNETNHFLVSMPTKFRKNVWVKRGDFVLVDPIHEGDKVKAEICKILSSEHIKEYTKLGIWPKSFSKKRRLENCDTSLDDLNELGKEFLINKNIQPQQTVEESDKSDSDESEKN